MLRHLVYFLSFSFVNSYITVWDGVDGTAETTCSSFTGRTMERGTVTPNQINGLFVSYMLDHDGALNTKSSGTNRNFEGWNSNYETNTLFKGNSLATNENTLNMGVPVPTLSECQAKCNQYDACIGVVHGIGLSVDHGSDEFACQFMTQCKRANAASAMRASYLRTTWEGFVPSSITPYTICDGSPNSEFNIVSTVKECFTQCSQSGNEVSHFELSPDLGCRCFSSCSNPTQALDDNNNHNEASWRTTIYGMPSVDAPTNSPTRKPTETPTVSPTTKPSKSPNTEPITAPTISTASPTVTQTESPTSATARATDADDGDGISAGTAVGLIVLGMVIIAFSFLAYTYLKEYINPQSNRVTSYTDF